MKVINLYAGPGSGKSTLMAGVFYIMKMSGMSVEMAPEYAKELVWEERKEELALQVKVFAEQLWRIKRLEGKVDYVVTDSPILLSMIYGNSESLHKLCLEHYVKMNNINFFVKREKPYDPNGRNETLDAAQNIDKRIKDMLKHRSIRYLECSIHDPKSIVNFATD